MAATYDYFHDAALTRPVTAIDPLRATISTDASRPTHDLVMYLGSPAAGKRARAESNPGVDTIITSVMDAGMGYGLPATFITLAASAGGLDAATPGAALDHGIATLLSGAGNAVAVHMRFGPYATPRQSTDVYPACNTLIEDSAP